mgnify:CR=1 FL=1
MKNHAKQLFTTHKQSNQVGPNNCDVNPYLGIRDVLPSIHGVDLAQEVFPEIVGVCSEDSVQFIGVTHNRWYTI